MIRIDLIEEIIDEREVKELESWTLVPNAVTGRKQFLIEGFLASGSRLWCGLTVYLGTQALRYAK